MSENKTATWSDIYQRGYILPIFFLCFGVWLHATDATFAATVMPVAVLEIGGVELINWVVSIYELGSILSAVLVPLFLGRFAMATMGCFGAFVFFAGCLCSAIALHMQMVVFGRLLQGLGAGMLISLALISISTIFPQRYFIRLMSCVSIVWGVSSFSGPLIGGIFAELGIWRWSFACMAFQAIIVLCGYHFYLRKFFEAHANTTPQTPSKTRITALPSISWRLGLLALGIILIATAGLVETIAAASVTLAIAITTLTYMLWRDKRSEHNILPRRLLTNTASGWGLGMCMLGPMGAIAITTYAPIFMQSLFATKPIMNGYIIALVSVGWSLAAITSANVPQHYVPNLIRCGILIVAGAQIGMAGGFYYASLPTIPICAAIEGIGFGMCWAYVSRQTIHSAPAQEQAKTAPSIYTVQRIGYSIGTALLGIVVNGLGFSLSSEMDEIRTIATITFLSPLPLIGCSAFCAWQLAKSVK